MHGDSEDYGNLPACSEEMLTVGRDEIISFSAGGGPVFSDWPSNSKGEGNNK